VLQKRRGLILSVRGKTDRAYLEKEEVSRQYERHLVEDVLQVWNPNTRQVALV